MIFPWLMVGIQEFRSGKFKNQSVPSILLPLKSRFFRDCKSTIIDNYYMGRAGGWTKKKGMIHKKLDLYFILVMLFSNSLKSFL